MFKKIVGSMMSISMLISSFGFVMPVTAAEAKLPAVAPVLTEGNESASAYEDVIDYTYPSSDGLSLMASARFPEYYAPDTSSDWDILDSGYEGSGWAFSAIEAREAWEQRETGVYPEYSPYHMAAGIYKNSQSHPWTFNTTTLDGGNRQMASAYFGRGSGPVGLGDFGQDIYNNYFYMDGIAPGYNQIPDYRNTTLAEYEEKVNSVPSSVQIANSIFLTGDESAYKILTDDAGDNATLAYSGDAISTIKDAIIKYGAVSSVYCSSEEGTLRNMGIDKADFFNPNTYAYCFCPDDETLISDIANGYLGANHAVTIVGWDDGYSAENFVKLPTGFEGLPENLDGAWIVRNSRGTDTTFAGSNGYEYISYYDYFIGQYATVFPGSVENIAYVNQYDGLYPNGSLSLGTYTTDVMNKFTTTASEDGVTTEYISAVGTYVTDANTTLRLKIDTYIDDSESDDGDLNSDAVCPDLKYAGDSDDIYVSGNSMTVTYPGYYIMELETPIAVKGEYETIITYESNNGDAVNIGYVGDDYGRLFAATDVAKEGSYFRPDESYYWYNAYTDVGVHIPVKTYNTYAADAPDVTTTPTPTTPADDNLLDNSQLNITNVDIAAIRVDDGYINYTLTIDYKFNDVIDITAIDGKQVSLIGYTFDPSFSPEDQVFTDQNVIFAIDQVEAQLEGSFVVNLTSDPNHNRPVSEDTQIILKLGSNAVIGGGAQAVTINLANAELVEPFAAVSARADVEQMTVVYGTDLNSALAELEYVEATVMGAEGQEVGGFAIDNWTLRGEWNSSAGAENIFVGTVVPSDDAAVYFPADGLFVEVRVVVESISYDDAIEVNIKPANNGEIELGTDITAINPADLVERIEVTNGYVTDTYSPNSMYVAYSVGMVDTSVAGTYQVAVKIGGISDNGYFDLEVPVEAVFAVTVVEPEPWYILGDVNGDAVINAVDCINIQRYVKFRTEPYMIEAADVNRDGKITGIDANKVQRFVRFNQPLEEESPYTSDIVNLSMVADTSNMEQYGTVTLNIYADGEGDILEYAMANYEIAYDRNVFDVESTTNNGGYVNEDNFGIMDLAAATVEKGAPIQTVTLKAIKDVTRNETHYFDFAEAEFVDVNGNTYTTITSSPASVTVTPSYDVALRMEVEPSAIKAGQTATMRIYAEAKSGSFDYSMGAYEVAYDNTVFEVTSSTEFGGFVNVSRSKFGIMDLASARIPNGTPIQTVTLKAIKDVDNIEDYVFAFEAAEFIDNYYNDIFVDSSATASLSILPAFKATGASVDPIGAFVIGTNVPAELNGLSATVYEDAAMAGKVEYGYATRNWRVADEQAADYAAGRPGTYTFVGEVVPDNSLSAYWDGTLTVWTSVELVPIAYGNIDVSINTDTISVVSSDKDSWTKDEIIAKITESNPVIDVSCNGFTDRYFLGDAMQISEINIPFDADTLTDAGGRYATAIITVSGLSNNGLFDLNLEMPVTFKILPSESDPTITIGKAEWIRPGSEVQVTIDIANNTGFTNLGIELDYDESVLTLIDVEQNYDVPGNLTQSENIDAHPYDMIWDSIESIHHNGTLATLTFRVADYAPDGEYPIKLSYSKGPYGDWVDGSDVNFNETPDGVFEPIFFGYVDGEIGVNNYLSGDINGDGRLNFKDGTTLMRYLADWDVYVVPPALDVNGDELVDNKDVTTLLRYLSGWNITIK